MKKFAGFAVAAAMISLSALSLTACGNGHHWGEWQYDAAGHWRACTDEDCEKVQFKPHKGMPCSSCGMQLRVLSFGFTEGGDSAHADFANEANAWFSAKAEELDFLYDFAGTDWGKLNDENLKNYDLVMFLNDRPSDHSQQAAFRTFMENGGAWMGFHAAAFSMEGNNEYWTWYQTDFLGCGNYKVNTWNPTSEPLTVEDGHAHCSTENIPDVFTSAPCEWYAWEKDLFENDDISVLLTLNPTKQNPAGDQPDKTKPHEIWTDGCHPVAWTNYNYNMVYMNWGHNLQPYNNGAEGTHSETFSCEEQCQFMLDAIFGLVTPKK